MLISYNYTTNIGPDTRPAGENLLFSHFRWEILIYSHFIAGGGGGGS